MKKINFYTIDKGLTVIVAAFIISRITFMFLGVRMIYPGGLESMPQLLSMHLLKGNLWQSLLYLHSQPPLFNLLTGITLQISGGYPYIACQSLYILMGMGITVFIYLLMRRLSVSRWISVIGTLLFMLGPSAIFYENTVNYEYPVMLLLMVSAYTLYGYTNKLTASSGGLFFACLAGLVLTRATFQLIWLVFLLIFLLLILKGQHKQLLLVAAIPLVLVSAWYIKNYLLFGQLSTSSWFGMNFSRITMYCIPEEWRTAMVDQHEISELGRLHSIYDYPLALHQEQKWGIAALDDVYKQDGINDFNYNNVNLIPASSQYLKDSISVLKKYPWDYLYCAAYAQWTYFQPPFDYDNKWHRISPLPEIEQIYRKTFYTNWLGPLSFLTEHRREDVRAFGKWLTSPTFLLVGYFMIFIYGTYNFIMLVLKKLQPSANRITLTYMALSMIYITVVSTLVDIGENNRFRYMADPFFVVFLCVMLSYCVDRIRSSPKTKKM